MPAVAERSIRILVDHNGLQAHLALDGVDPDLLTSENILAALKQQNIPVTDAVAARVQQIEEMNLTGNLPTKPVLLAEGREPIEGAGASFELKPELSTHPADEGDDLSPADFHRSLIVTVEAGTTIGTMQPEVSPVAGINIFGKPVAARSSSRSIKLGANVSLADDGQSVVANKSGKVHITHHEVAVLPVVEIPGDVDYSTGNVDAPGDMLINGTIRDTFKVKAAGSLTIRGAIESAEVEVRTDLHVNGGITGHDKIHIVAGGEIFTKFCNEASLEADGDITITREALNCRIRTGGHLLIGRGKLIGGMIYARNGAEVAQLGNDVNIKSRIAIGVDPRVLLEAIAANEAIKKKRNAITKIRQCVVPLMAQIKRLTPGQRQQAADLLRQAKALEQEIAAHELCRTAAEKQKLAADGSEINLVIHKFVYPGVSIIFGDKIATLNRERKGPFRVVCRIHNRVEEILVIDKVSGSISVLNSRDYEPTPEDVAS